MTPSRGFALAALLAFAPLARAQAILPGPSGEKAILADFVEITSRQVMRRDASLLELVNDSELTLDVTVGESGTTLEPKQRMLAGVEPGIVKVKVLAHGVSASPLEGDLQVEGGRHYELALAFAVPPTESTSTSTPSGKAVAAHSSAAPSEPNAKDPEPVKPRKDKVDVGRKRARDR